MESAKPSVIQRSIKIENIIVVDETNARFEEIPEREEYFKGILKEAPEKIPPIEVLLIQKLEEGVPRKNIAKEEGVSVDTVQRTKKSLTDRKNGKSKKTAKIPNETFDPSASKSPTSPVDR